MERSWGGYSSGSDDESERQAGSVTKPEIDEGTVYYPVRLLDHKNMYANVLYDVEGNPLLSPDGQHLNVYTKKMQEAFDAERLRLIHYISSEPSYRYFVTSKTQKREFQKHRTNGSTDKLTYHVYVDEDVDRSSQEYKEFFNGDCVKSWKTKTASSKKFV